MRVVAIIVSFQTSPRLDLFNIEIRGIGGCRLESGVISSYLLCCFLWQSIFRQQYAGQLCFPLARCSPLGVPLVVSPLACPGLSFHGALANTQRCLADPTTNSLSHREAKKTWPCEGPWWHPSRAKPQTRKPRTTGRKEKGS